MTPARAISIFADPSRRGGRHAAGTARIAVLAMAFAVAGCKRPASPQPAATADTPSAAPAAPPIAARQDVATAPPLPDIACPPPAAFASFVDEPAPAPRVTPPSTKPGAAKPAAVKATPAKPRAAAKRNANPKVPRALRTACTVYAPGRFWLAAALSYDEGTGKNPHFALLSGSPAGGTIVFDVDTIPPAEIETLIRESARVNVQIRKTREANALVRVGVVGGAAENKPDQREVGALVQLVAHHAPQVLWMGAGDQVVSDASGCITEHRIDFELLFRTRLERIVVSRTLPDATGKVPAACPATGASAQETLPFAPVDLPRGRGFPAVVPSRR